MNAEHKKLRRESEIRVLCQMLRSHASGDESYYTSAADLIEELYAELQGRPTFEYRLREHLKQNRLVLCSQEFVDSVFTQSDRDASQSI